MLWDLFKLLLYERKIPSESSNTGWFGPGRSGTFIEQRQTFNTHIAFSQCKRCICRPVREHVGSAAYVHSHVFLKRRRIFIRVHFYPGVYPRAAMPLVNHESSSFHSKWRLLEEIIHPQEIMSDIFPTSCCLRQQHCHAEKSASGLQTCHLNPASVTCLQSRLPEAPVGSHLHLPICKNKS